MMHCRRFLYYNGPWRFNNSHASFNMMKIPIKLQGGVWFDSPNEPDKTTAIQHAVNDGKF